MSSSPKPQDPEIRNLVFITLKWTFATYIQIMVPGSKLVPLQGPFDLTWTHTGKTLKKESSLKPRK